MRANEGQSRTANDRNKIEQSRTSHWLLSRRGPAFLDWFFRFGDQSIKHVEPFIKMGHVIADLGCGWGHFSFALADRVGSEGKVYSVDLAPKVIAKIRQKAKHIGQHHLEAYISSAADLSFIRDKSVDFVFANGLLCSMAIDRPSAVAEMKRILKSSGHAYLSLGASPPLGYVDEKEWDFILQGFMIDSGGRYQQKWAVVSLRNETP